MLSTKELGELRPWVSGEVTRVLGFSESTIVTTALDCIGRSLNSQATAGEDVLSFITSITNVTESNLPEPISIGCIIKGKRPECVLPSFSSIN